MQKTLFFYIFDSENQTFLCIAAIDDIETFYKVIQSDILHILLIYLAFNFFSSFSIYSENDIYISGPLTRKYLWVSIYFKDFCILTTQLPFKTNFHQGLGGVTYYLNVRICVPLWHTLIFSPLTPLRGPPPLAPKKSKFSFDKKLLIKAGTH